MFDLLIKNCAVVTMDDHRNVFHDAAIGIEGAEIVALGPQVAGEARRTIDARGHVALPGLINCHTHVYQSLIEGIGYDMHFDPWNWRYLFPIVSKMQPEHAEISALLAALEMIKSGTTTVSDHWYLHTDFDNVRRVAKAFERAGMRHHVVYGLLDQTFAGERIESEYMTMIQREDELLEQARAFVRDWHGRGRTTAALGPGSTEDITPRLMRKTVQMADELGLGVATHVAGWEEVVSASYKQFGMRDLEYVHSVGLTGPKAIIIHAVWLSDREISILVETESKVVHCPVANMHLGYGVASVSQMLARGVTVGLGTDGAASYTYDLFEVMKTAAMLQKVVHIDAEALTAEESLAMATCDGARVLGLSDVGSLAPGKRADLILVDFGQPHLMLTGRLAPKLVYSACGCDVVTSIIDGQLVMEDRRVLTLNEEDVLHQAEAATRDLMARAGPETAALLEAPWPRSGAAWRVSVGRED
ncbi:MAG: amidohydrolase [Anaerolineales bacterium]|nr:MAG: amidohydrolase [Anaerolineales bacterium]